MIIADVLRRRGARGDSTPNTPSGHSLEWRLPSTVAAEIKSITSSR